MAQLIRRLGAALLAITLALLALASPATDNRVPFQDGRLEIPATAVFVPIRPSEFLPYEQKQGPPYDLLAQVTTNPNVTGDCPPGTQTVTGVTGWVGRCEERSFAVALQNSLIPEEGRGDRTPTYTRASPAYQQDFEGKQNLVLSGEARFQGARRVQNLVQASENSAGWLLQTGAVQVSNTQTAPDGSSTAFQFSVPNAGAIGVGSRVSIGTNAAGAAANSSVWLKADVAGNIVLTEASGSVYSITVPLTTSWQRFETGEQAIPLSVWHSFYRPAGSPVTNIYVWHPQREATEGQAIKTSSEYVSVGVLSAPYHGAGVDGVQYFNTLNGNTVASNVVTEATGAPIVAGAAGVSATAPVDAGGPYGYLAEGLRTNLALQSQTLQTSWNLSSAADMNVVAADAYVAPDGTTTMDKLQPKATNSTHYILQPIAVAPNAIISYSFYVRYINHQWVTLLFSDGATNFAGSFDILNGVVGAKTANTTSKIEPTGLSGVYRIQMNTTVATGAGASSIYLSMNGSDSATLQSWSAAGTELLGVWGAQLEAASFASTYIPTTTTALARNADTDQYVSSGNIPASNNNFTLYGETTFPVVPSAASYYLWSSYVDANNSTSVLWDGTNLIARRRIGGTSHDATIALTPVAGTAFKWAAVFSSTTGTQIYLNGTAGTSDATTTACQIGAAFQVNADGNSANQPYATSRNDKIYPTDLSAARAKAITSDAADWLGSSFWRMAANDDAYRIAVNQ